MNRKMLSSRSSHQRLLSAGALALAALAHSDTPTVSVTSMAKPIVTGAVQTGLVPSSAMLSMTLSLAPSNLAALEAFANSVSNPASRNYHRFLSPAQVGERFGASASTVNTAVAYLKSKGMTVTLIAPNRMAILFRGRADKVSSAFATKLATFSAANRTDGGPKKFFSYLTPPKLPSSFATRAITIDGLQNAIRPVRRSTLTPDQARTLYNASTLFGPTSTGGRKGAGINVGITNYDGYRLSNLPLFYSSYGLPVPDGGVGSNVSVISVNGRNGNVDPAGGEGDLDIQMVLSAAPKANVIIFDAGNVVDDLDAYAANYLAPLVAEAANSEVDIVTESYGFITDASTRGTIQSAHLQHLSMTAAGVTYMLASGDHGTRDPQDYPDFDPEVLNVGGTVATVDTLGNRLSEVGWVGSGGGYGTFDVPFNVLPPYQQGLGGVAAGINRRLVPDIALHASGGNKLFEDASYGTNDFAYYLILPDINQVPKQTVSSGTSASSPLFAGQFATILEELSAQGIGDIAPNGRLRQGRINDFLYNLNGDPSVFFDVVDGGSNGVLPNGTVSSVGPGWDFVTGLGAPDIQGLLDAYLSNASLSVTASPISASVFGGFGVDLQGSATGTDTGLVDALVVSDGSPLSLQSVKKPGLGQVAAASVDVKLGGSNRRSATVRVAVSSPELTTGYVYLYDFATGKFDDAPANVTTITGNGGMRTVSIPIVLAEDGSSRFIGTNGGTDMVRVLVRAIKPQRLGSAPFRLSVDQATVIERVPRS